MQGKINFYNNNPLQISHYIKRLKKAKTRYTQCRGKGPKLYIGPWALAEDIGWSEDK